MTAGQGREGGCISIRLGRVARMYDADFALEDETTNKSETGAGPTCSKHAGHSCQIQNHWVPNWMSRRHSKRQWATYPEKREAMPPLCATLTLLGNARVHARDLAAWSPLPSRGAGGRSVAFVTVADGRGVLSGSSRSRSQPMGSARACAQPGATCNAVAPRAQTLPIRRALRRLRRPISAACEPWTRGVLAPCGSSDDATAAADFAPVLAAPATAPATLPPRNPAPPHAVSTSSRHAWVRLSISTEVMLKRG